MAKDFIANLGTRVKAEMEVKKLSVKELCTRTGMSKSTIYNILNESSITAVGAVNLANALGVTTDYLLRGITHDTQIPYMPQYACTHFKCADPEKSDSKRCCFYCPNKKGCSNPCLNNPAKCGLFM